MRYEKDKRKNIVFPLGGIGTGSVGINGACELRDFEIFGRPRRNTGFGYTHFALRSESKSGVDFRILQGDTLEDYMGGHSDTYWRGYGFGPSFDGMSGLPHFRNVDIDASFPLFRATLSDEDTPLVARLLAFNPFIPGDEDSSSIPAGFFEWEIENRGEARTVCDVILSLQNHNTTGSVNESFRMGKVTGIFFTDERGARDELGYTDMAIATDGEDTKTTTYWYRGQWHDALTTFLRSAKERGGLENREYDTPGKGDTGSVSARFTLEAGESKRVRFVISWSTPRASFYLHRYDDENGNEITWRQYHATVYKTSVESSLDALARFDKLLSITRKFHKSIWESSVPEFVKDAAASNLAVLKSSTCLRLEGGEFWAWEGSQERIGSCDGTCQHVWNYEYATAHLFPRMARGMRESTMNRALFPSGATEFRVHIPYGTEHNVFRPCVDGQMGEVIKCYREWKLSGDVGWLRTYKDKIFSMLEYAWSPENPDKWDRNMDGVLEGRQHHTLDMELFGPSSWLEGMYLLALACAEEIARFLGEDERALKYRRIRESGTEYTNERLFKNGYFYHEIDIDDLSVPRSYDAENYVNEERGEVKYQIADGCFIDQVLADYHAHLIGMPTVFDKEKKLSALRSILKYNWKASMRGHLNVWRVFSLNDEGGVIMCSYPDGVRTPEIPIPYADETMTGFEYSLAALMIKEGMKDEGEEIVRAIRDRYDGYKRNPFAELECGASYARSMASFSLLSIYSGMTYDMTRGHLGFSPISGFGKYFFAVGGSFGTVEFEKEKITLKIEGEPLSLRSLGLNVAKCPTRMLKDGTNIDFTYEGGELCFASSTISESLVIEI